MPPITTTISSAHKANATKPKAKSGTTKKLAIVVGVCAIFLLSSFDEGVLLDARSTIVPRILAAVILDEADDDHLAHNVGPPPVDEDTDTPLNLTSTYQHHELLMAERRLASPAPSSADIVPGNEYIVRIKSWGLSYTTSSTTGRCYIADQIKGTFYAQDTSGRCFKIQVNEDGTNTIYQTEFSTSQCTDDNNPSSYKWHIGTQTTLFPSTHYVRYRNGDECPEADPAGPRNATVLFRFDKNMAVSEYTTSVTEPTMCNYRIYITVQSCVGSSQLRYVYRYATYSGSEQATSLVNKIGGGTVTGIYQYSLPGFTATLTSSQADALRNELIVDFVEPNYVVHSRHMLGLNGEGVVPGHSLRHRRLAVPMFNVKEPAAHWGLERLSSRGAKNGNYLYFHIGEKTHLYMFDTAINENHDEFWPFDRFGSEAERKVCVGNPNDYLTNVHGTHAASLAAGMTYGTARNATIHPVQVLDANGKGTTVSVLCGIEWLVNDQLQYNYANEAGSGTRKSIASITWGTSGRSDALDNAIGNLAKVGGILAVVAAGNNGGE